MGSERRGYVLEGFICRLKINEMRTNNRIRFVIGTSTIDELDSLCSFFGFERTKKIKFGDEVRDIPLEKIVLGFDFPQNYNNFQFDHILTNNLLNVVSKYRNGRQALIYCPTRKICEQTAIFLRRNEFKQSINDIKKMNDLVSKITTESLKDCMSFGVAYHHSGLGQQDKRIIEQAYNCKLISVLCCTTSLANAKNFPSNFVIVKGTIKFVDGSKAVPLDEIDIEKMIGPSSNKLNNLSADQPKNQATAIIMTKKCFEKTYNQIISNKSLESRLHDHLCELINTEIIIGHLKSFDDVMNYIQTTYLHIRLQTNPEHYGISKKTNIDDSIRKWIKKVLDDLKLFKVINSTGQDYQIIEKSQIGQIMNENCVYFQTIKNFSKINSDQTISMLMFLLCQSKELNGQAYLRNDEKNLLNDLNKPNKLKFPICNKNTYKIQDANQKINCLIQACLDDLLDGDQRLKNLHQEAIVYLRTSRSLAKALVDYLHVQSGKSFSTFKNAILLCKSLHAGK